MSQNCFYHPDTEAEIICGKCQNNICMEDRIFIQTDEYYCKWCKNDWTIDTVRFVTSPITTVCCLLISVFPIFILINGVITVDIIALFVGGVWGFLSLLYIYSTLTRSPIRIPVMILRAEQDKIDFILNLMNFPGRDKVANHPITNLLTNIRCTNCQSLIDLDPDHLDETRFCAICNKIVELEILTTFNNYEQIKQNYPFKLTLDT